MADASRGDTYYGKTTKDDIRDIISLIEGAEKHIRESGDCGATPEEILAEGRLTDSRYYVAPEGTPTSVPHGDSAFDGKLEEYRSNRFRGLREVSVKEADDVTGVPELENEPEFKKPEQAARPSCDRKTEKPEPGPTMPFMLGESVAKDWDPFKETGTVDMIKEGEVRVRNGSYSRWFPTRKLVKTIKETPDFGVNHAVATKEYPWRVLGHVAYFSSDGSHTYVRVDGGDIQAFGTEDIVSYNPDYNPHDYDPVLDNPDIFKNPL